MGLESVLPACGERVRNPSTLRMAHPGMNVIHVAGHRLDGAELRAHQALGDHAPMAQISGEPQALASQQVLWVHPTGLAAFPFPAANARIIAALLQRFGHSEESSKVA